MKPAIQNSFLKCSQIFFKARSDWLNVKQITVIALLSFIPFLFHVLHPLPLGTDAVFFYLYSCSAPNIPTIPIQPLAKLFFEALPCNELFFKLVSSVFLFASSLIVAKTGELFDKKYGWLAGVFVFISIAWVGFHIQVEDDLLGYPFLFASIYFFLKGIRDNGKINKAIAVALVLFVGAFVWKGALLYLIVLALFWLPALIILFGVVAFIGFGSIGALLGNDLIAENMNFVLYTLAGAGTLGLGHGVGLLGLYIYRYKVWLFVPFLIALLLNLKWAVHLSPFLGIGLMLIVRDFDLKIQAGKLRLEPWVNAHFVHIFVAMAFIGVMAQGVGLLLQPPYSTQLEAVSFAVKQANGALMDNDWSYGYWIMYFGGNTQTYGGGWPRYTESWNDEILLTENPQINPDCKLLKVWKQGGFYQTDLRVYNCKP